VIRTNLATRPFYNEHLIHVWLAVACVAVLAATGYNVSRVLRYSRSDTTLATQASRDEARAADLRRQAAKLRASVDAQQVDFAAADARQANELIDRRTFSWTELFNRFEATLPDDVRITSVQPKVDRDHRITLAITVVAKTVGDVDQFMKRLDETGAFKDLYSTDERPNDEGQIESALTMIYVPEAPK